MTQKADEISSFILEHGKTFYVRDQLIESVEQFIKNDTYVTVTNNDGRIIAACLWNINGDTASVEEAVIHPEYRGLKLLKCMGALGFMKFPFLKKIKFCRERKYEGRAPREVILQKFLGGL